MQAQHIIREKAVRLAVRTGEAPDLDFIWTAQRTEGASTCFGSYGPACSPECCWRERCLRLSDESLDPAWPAETRAPSTEKTAGTSPLGGCWIPPLLRGLSPPSRSRTPV